MAKCAVCGKGPQFGHHVSHSKHRTNRMWRPNLQKGIVMVNGRPRKVNVCANCLRTLSRQG